MAVHYLSKSIANVAFDTGTEAREAYEQIISASKEGERICDLRRPEQ